MIYPFEIPFGERYYKAHLKKITQQVEVFEHLIPWIKNPKDILHLCGDVGTGKTYIAAAWFNHLISKDDTRMQVRAYKEIDFFGELKSAMTPKGDLNYRLKRICESPILIIDDMASGNMSPWQIEMLEALIDMRVSCMKPTMITSNLNRESMVEIFSKRFVSRMYARNNLTLELLGDDRRLEEGWDD